MFNKVLFIGLGGAGQRHLRIFRDLIPECQFFGLRKIKKTPTLDPSFNVLANKKLEDIYGISIFNNESIIEEIKPDFSIVSVPNSLHSYYTKLLFQNNSHILLEKPGIIDSKGSEILQNTYLQSDLTFRVGYQRKFNPLFLIFKKFIKNNYEDIKRIEVKVSSFIPNWHPYEDFRDLYACRKELGGGVLLTETHELNMIIDLFGLPEEWSHDFKNESNHNLDVADSCKSIFKYSGFNVNFDLSFYRIPPERKIFIQLNKGFLNFNLDKNILTYEVNNKRQKINHNFDSDYLFINQALDFLKFDLNKSKRDINNELIYQKIIS